VNGLPGEKQQQLARRCADIFGIIVKHHDWISRVTFWGLSDADSWLNRGRMNYPLLGIGSANQTRHFRRLWRW
jgi:endo-1,4-beta-xylanase